MSDITAAIHQQVLIPSEVTKDPYSFARFLSAKKSVDDRALNRQVWEHLSRSLPTSKMEFPLRILEVGAGIGTMIERVLEWDLVRYACYTALDSSEENLQVAAHRLEAWAIGRGMQVSYSPKGLSLRDEDHLVQLSFEAADVRNFIDHNTLQRWDLLIAHAFLDLVDVPSVLPELFRMLAPEGLFLLTINFDGLTILEPVSDPSLDEQILNLYHRTMDNRLIQGKPSGDSRAGRHLFHQVKAAGGEILSAGASDWMVYSGSQGYPYGEAYFLHHIIHFIEKKLMGHPELDQDQFADWIRARHAQVESGELVYIAHQIDFFGKVNAKALMNRP